MTWDALFWAWVCGIVVLVLCRAVSWSWQLVVGKRTSCSCCIGHEPCSQEPCPVHSLPKARTLDR